MQPGPDPLASTDPLEGRSDPRTASDLTAEIFARGLRGGLPARTCDLSVGGACLVTPSPFAFKEIERVRVVLPDGPLELMASGRWQHAPHGDPIVLTGVSFERLPDASVDRLWDQVLEAGKRMARFLYARSDLRGIGLEGAMGLAQLTRFRDLAAGSTLYRQGPASNGERSIFLVDRGAITLQMRVRDALEVPMERVTPGGLFGGLPLVAGVDHAETAIAEEASRVLEIDERAYHHVTRSRPWLAQRLAQAVTCTTARRLHAILARVRDQL